MKRRIWLLPVLGAASLALGHLAASQHASAGRLARITFYQDVGYTASGLYTAPGLAGCSYDLPLGTRVSVAGDVYLCADRGNVGAGVPYSWIDIWAADGWSWVPQRYGDYAEIEVLDD